MQQLVSCGAEPLRAAVGALAGVRFRTAEARVLLAAMMIGGGVIRLVDGRLFVLTPLAYGRDAIYGVALLLLGTFLLATFPMRRVALGRIAASFASALYFVLAATVAGTSSVSAFNALVFGVALLIERRS